MLIVFHAGSHGNKFKRNDINERDGGVWFVLKLLTHLDS